MNNKKTLTLALAALSAMLTTTSCQDEEFGYTAQDIKTSVFRNNFEKEYGAISPDQSWDLTHYMTRTAKYEDSMLDYLLNQGQTRATDANGVVTKNPAEGDLGYYEGGYYVVEEQTIRWLRGFLKEGKNNTDLGTAFSMVAPSNQFAIIPIYQGFANMDWSLHMKVNGVDTQLWTESQDILVRDSDTDQWTTVGTSYGTSQTIYSRQIKSKPILVDFGNSTVKDFTLSLHIDTGLENYANAGTDQTSSTGMMLALSCPIPTNVGKTNVNGVEVPNYAMVIGCEDSDLKNSDWDMNDVCFLIIGYPMIPDRVQMTSKRYMCEDLGNTFDFDFNDIVVDVTEILREHYEPTKNDFEPSTDGKKQYANIKHLCGTIPLQVTVGDYTFPWITDPTKHAQTLTELQSDASDHPTIRPVTVNNGSGVNWEPDVVKQITGWDTNENNISVRVYTAAGEKNTDVFTDKFGDNLSVKEDKSDEHLYILNFPGRGETPLMLATDQTTQWKAEHEHITEAWWKDGEHRPTSNQNQENVNPGQGGGTSGGNATIPDHLVNLDEDGNAVIWEAPEGFEGWNSGSWGGTDILTNFLDAVFEGYTVLEIEFASDNSAHQFRFIKVRNNWENYQTVQITDGKFVHAFTGDIVSSDEYYLGFAIMMDDSGGTLKPSKMVMKKPANYTLTINNGDHGTVAVNPAANSEGQYAEGTQVTLTVTPASGWYFDQWSDGNKSNPRTVTISGNLELTPSYTDVEPTYIWAGPYTINNYGDNKKYEITANVQEGDKLIINVENKANGNVEIIFSSDWNTKGQATWNEGDKTYEITLTGAQATALNGFGGIMINAENMTVNTIDLEKPIQYTISVATTDAAQGSVEIVGKTGSSFTGSGTVQLKATPVTGYKFASWTTPSGTSTDNPLSVTLSESVDGKTYTANFAVASKYSITVTAGENGSVNTTGGEYYEGTQVTFTATPNDGYRVKQWTKNGTAIAGEKKNTLTITVSGNDTYGVEFEEGPTSEVVWEGSNNGKFQELAYGGQNMKQNGASMTLIECLDNGLTKLAFTFDKESNVWYEILGAKENGTGGWHKILGGNTNGKILEIDLSDYVNTIKTEDGIVLQGGDYGNLIKVEAHQ